MDRIARVCFRQARILTAMLATISRMLTVEMPVCDGSRLSRLVWFRAGDIWWGRGEV